MVKRAVTEVKEMDKLAQEPTPVSTSIEPTEATEGEFQVQYDEVDSTVSFELADGTSVVIKEPTTRHILLIQSFLKQRGEDYNTEAFIMLALASYAITKYGNKPKVTFDYLVDNLSFDDLGRVTNALAYFQDFFNSISKRAGAASPEQ